MEAIKRVLLGRATIWDNIDVKAEWADEEIARVLSELEIDYFQLEDPVDKSGKNFSVGERQMICLTRSLLSDKKIIVMDEPTSHIDLATDSKIQELILSKFADRTLIVIAHRKETIADFEMIYSMDEPSQ